MTHWLGFSEADFDATRAARTARAHPAGQPGLFFVATPVKPARPGREAGQLPGQAAMFGTDAPAEFVVTRHDQLCSGGREPIEHGARAYEDAGGWVWCPAHMRSATR